MDLNELLNSFIFSCNKKFSIERYNCNNIPHDRLNSLKKLIMNESTGFINTSGQCYRDTDILNCDDGNVFIDLFLFQNDVVGYIDYMIFDKVMYIMYSCNSTAQRGKYINILLCFSCFINAFDKNVEIIVSYAMNDIMKGILKKLNFTEIDDLYSAANVKYSKISFDIQNEFNMIIELNKPSDESGSLNRDILISYIIIFLKDNNKCKLKAISNGGKILQHKTSYKRKQSQKHKRSKKRTRKRMVISK
jgi:hypothetical protein